MRKNEWPRNAEVCSEGRRAVMSDWLHQASEYIMVADEIIIYLENPKQSTGKQLELAIQFSKGLDTSLMYKN